MTPERPTRITMQVLNTRAGASSARLPEQSADKTARREIWPVDSSAQKGAEHASPAVATSDIAPGSFPLTDVEAQPSGFDFQQSGRLSRCDVPRCRRTYSAFCGSFVSSRLVVVPLCLLCVGEYCTARMCSDVYGGGWCVSC